MKKILKTIYILFIVLLWTLVFCLSIEVATRILLTTANYLYRPLFEHQNAKVYQMVKLSEDLKKPTKTEKTDPQKNTPTSPYYPNSNQRVLNNNIPCDKNYELTLQGIAEIHFDKKGNITESYGDPIIEQYIYKLVNGFPTDYYDPAWNTVIEKIKNPSPPFFSGTLKYEKHYLYHYHIEILPKSEGVVLFAKEIRDGYPLSLQTPGIPENEDSPWSVIYFSYKTNWKKQGSIAQYNNFGFRDDDIILPKPDRVFRIICIGGSTTEEGNSNDLSYPNIMEKKLQKYFQTQNIEVINAGICGIRSFGEVRRINDFLQLQPDLLVYYNAINDICYYDIPFWIKLPNPYLKIIPHSAFLTQIFNRKLLPSDEYIAEYFQKTILRNLGSIHCACKKQNILMAICSFAYPKIKWYEFIERLYYDFNLRNVWLTPLPMLINFATYQKVIQIYNRELKKLCEQENILYIPVAEEFNAGADHFFDVCHMTLLGMDPKTDIIGSHLAHWIETHNLLKKSP